MGGGEGVELMGPLVHVHEAAGNEDDGVAGARLFAGQFDLARFDQLDRHRVAPCSPEYVRCIARQSGGRLSR